MRFGSVYAIVPDQVIRALRSRADSDSGLHRLNCAPLLTPGTAVRIAKGPFEGLEGVFESAVGAERVVVLLKLLGQNAPVHISVDLVLPSQAVYCASDA